MKDNLMRCGLALLVLASSAWSQDAAKSAGTAPVQQAADTPEAKLADIVARYKAKQQQVYDDYEKATTDEQRAEILKALPGKEFVAEFRGLAEAVKGTDTAAHAWMWVLQLADGDKQGALGVIDTLLEQHMESEVLSELAGFLRYAGYELGEDPVVKALHAMIEFSPLPKVQASALFTLGAILVEGKGETRCAEGRKYLERVVAEFGKVDSGRGTYGDAAGRFLFELDNLKVGKLAPDFDVIDENGVPWKLSDYRGKVVVIDFWGNW